MIPRGREMVVRYGRDMTLERLRDGLARRLATTEGLRNPDRRRALWMRYHGITLVLDVGANVGQYVERLRRLAQYTDRVVSFEPASDAFTVLINRSEQDALWECEHVAEQLSNVVDDMA